MKDTIICPVCGRPLVFGEKTVSCANGHSFDRSKEGSVNLILNGSPSAGDDPGMVSARKEFLNGGYYSHLTDALTDILAQYIKDGDTVLDACCGEGYFTNALAERFINADFYGFDLSKRAVRYAAKSSWRAVFFAANISSIPAASGSADVLLHIFAPVCESEFSRVLKDDGVFVHVFPGRNHLMGIKEMLYDAPRGNDEDPGISDIFEEIYSGRTGKEAALDNRQLKNLLCMTPYFYRTPKQKIAEAMEAEKAVTETEFIIKIYRKRRPQTA